MNIAIAFSSYIPNNDKLYVGQWFLDKINLLKSFVNIEVFCGVNYGSCQQWINKISQSNFVYDIVPKNLHIDSDASGYQLALKLIKNSNKDFDYIFFIHTKGGVNDRDSFYIELDNLFFNNQSFINILDRLKDEKYGGYAPWFTFTTGPKINSLDTFYKFNFTPFFGMFLQSFYVIKYSIIKEFLYNCSNDFYEKNLVTELGFDRYFFERDMATIINRMGKEMSFDFYCNHPVWNIVNEERYITEMNKWKLENNL